MTKCGCEIVHGGMVYEKIAYQEADRYTDALQSVIHEAEQAIAKAEGGKPNV